MVWKKMGEAPRKFKNEWYAKQVKTAFCDWAWHSVPTKAAVFSLVKTFETVDIRTVHKRSGTLILINRQGYQCKHLAFE